jgi:hypothetical protein
MDRIFFLIVALAISISAELVTDTCNLIREQAFNIEKDSVSAGFRNGEQCSMIPPDIFVGSAENCCLALQCCCGLRVGSGRFWYLSKKQFSESDFSKPLNLSDTSLFKKIDTVPDSFNRLHCTKFPSVVEPSTWGNPSTEQLTAIQNNFFVIKTESNHYAVVHVKKFLYNKVDPGVEIPGYTPCINGIAIEWFLQKNSSLDFSEIERASMERKSVVNMKTNSLLNVTSSKTLFYNPQGRVLTGGVQKQAGLIIRRVISSNGEIVTNKVLISQ